MEQKLEQQPTAPKRRMSNFMKALLVTAIPVGGLSIISSAGIALAPRSRTQSVFVILWFVSLAIWALAIMAAIGFAIARQKKITAGIFAGIGIGLVTLGVSCLANLSLY